MIEWITEFKPITIAWHYTENELPEQYEECFCDTGKFHGYQTLTYIGTEFYDKECVGFEVTRWARVSEIVTMLNKNTADQENED